MNRHIQYAATTRTATPRASWLRGALTVVLLSLPSACSSAAETPLNLRLQSQEPAAEDASDEFKVVTRAEQWSPDKTAVIVCDMWDSHHCFRAVQRENQMVPRMESLLNRLRDRGVTIIHAPSSCMDAYVEHPARHRVFVLSPVPVPKGIDSWCHTIPAEEVVQYPIDQSDGGEDDTPEEHQAWVAELVAQGRDPKAPWKRQHAGLSINDEKDYITDQGDEVWTILQHRRIENVILLGVHVNMCVLGRPFGLRNLAKNGVHVVLMRDLTDSMYNPKAWPHVSHQEGTDLIISHIERHVCPTVTSDQVLGGEPFHFAMERDGS